MFSADLLSEESFAKIRTESFQVVSAADRGRGLYRASMKSRAVVTTGSALLAFAFVVSAPETARAEDEPPRVVLTVTHAPPSLVLLLSALFGRSCLSLTNGRELAPRGSPALRHPDWIGPEPPKPPALHARLLRITF